MTRLRQKLALAVVLAAIGGQASAQFGGGGMGGGRRGGRSADAPASTGRGSGDRPASPEMRASQLRDKLYDLRLRLLITPEQAALWDSFYAKVWDLSSRTWLAHATPEDQTAVQAMQQRAAEAQERATRLQDLNEAVGRLYAALTPDQRRIADQSLAATLP